MLEVKRPAPPKRKINTRDDFELCLLRHQYFRRAKYNPTEEEMKPYMYIVENLSKNTFFTYFNLFKSVGMYQDDVLNIGRVHLVSFLGLYSLEKMESKKKEFADNTLRYKYREATQADFDQKNRANFTLFFKQRMEDLVRVCRQKVRNIKGKNPEEFAVFCGTENPPKNPKQLLKNHLDFNYKKIDFSIFKSIRKKANVNYDSTMFKFDGLWYVAIALEQTPLEIDDFITSESNPYENFHNMRPDELYEEKESEIECSSFFQRSNYRQKDNFKKIHCKK